MSLLGTLLRPKSFPTPPTIAAACGNTARGCANARREESHIQRSSGGDSIGGGRRWHAPRQQTALSVEDVFVQSLVTASTCRACSAASSIIFARERRTNRTISDHQRGLRHRSRATSNRSFSTARPRLDAGTAVQVAEEPDDEPPVLGESIPRDKYQELVDTYGNAEAEGQPKHEHYRLAPRLALTPEQESRPPYAKRKILEPIDAKHSSRLRRLRMLLREEPGTNTRRIYQDYYKLPTPRLRYLDNFHVHQLLHHLTWVERRTYENSERFSVVFEDALSERVPLGVLQWNTAIAFAGRSAGIGSEEVKTAIEMWLRMEREGGVSADNVTFNILFDLAVKAGRFALADTIYAEMDRRKMKLNRYFRTSKIYYAGKRGDAENVRAAFRDFVAAGEIVDTAAMNCVILSLVRCGETASAEHVMGKMKLLHEQKFGQAALVDWREKKAMGQRLNKSAQQLRADRESHLSSFFGSPYVDEDKKEDMQRAAPIAPDDLTYRILIQWHARVSGNLDKIRTYVGAIEAAGQKVRHNVFFQLFVGFERHGGYAFTAWNRKSLEGFWREYIASIAGDAAAMEIAARVKARMKDSSASPPPLERYEIYPLDPSDAFDSTPTSPNTPAAEEEDVDEDLEPTPSHLAPMEFRSGTVMAALAAFYKCAGFKRMLEVWEEVQEAWGKGMHKVDRQRIEGVVEEKRRESGVYVD